MTLYQGALCNLEFVVDQYGEEFVRMSDNRVIDVTPKRLSHRVQLDSLEAEPDPADYILGERPIQELVGEGTLDLVTDCTDVASRFGSGYSLQLRDLMNQPHPSGYRPSDTSSLSD